MARPRRSGPPARGRGLCECGCGGETRLATRTNRRLGHTKGQPIRFILGHSGGARRGPAILNDSGYRLVSIPDHPRADARGYVREHVVIAERALGRALPDGAEVHHFNGKKSDNRRGNLVLCEDRAYHMLLHQRARALSETGHADWIRCEGCLQYKDPRGMSLRSDRPAGKCRPCMAAYSRSRRAARAA